MIVIFEKIIETLLLLELVTGVLIIFYVENDKVRKILGKILVSELIAFVIGVLVSIWIY